MDILECVTPLLSEEDGSQCVNHGQREDSEGASSGYESNDNLDKESVASQDEHYDYTNCDSSRKQPEEIMNFRNITSLSSTLRLITEMSEMCDVTFVIGPSEVLVHGVRAILAARSLVFHQLILQHLPLPTENENISKQKKSQQKTKYGLYRSRSVGVHVRIPVKKYDPEVFRKLVEFAHCGNITISEDIVVGLYCGASQFRFKDLASACLDYIDRCLQHGRAELLMTSLKTYTNHRASQVLFERMNKAVKKDTRRTDKV